MGAHETGELTSAGASEEWNTGVPIRGLLDGAVGVWCCVSVRAHFVGSMADRLRRVLLPVSVLAIAWFLAACVVDYATPPVAPEASLLASVVVVVLAATVDTLVMGWPLVLGIRNGLDYWSPGRFPKGRSVVRTNRPQNG